MTSEVGPPEAGAPVFSRGAAIVFAVAFVLPGAVLALAEWSLFAGFGRALYGPAVLGAVASLFIAGAGGVLMLLLLLLKRARLFALRWLVAVPLILFSVLLGSRLGSGIRFGALQTIATNGTPLAQAIGAYEHSNGHAPTRLAVLVPAFLPAIPEPGVGVAPQFEYESGTSGAAAEADSERAAEPWRLFVLVPGVIFPSTLTYDPPNPQGAPERAVRRRFGDWVYAEL